MITIREFVNEGTFAPDMDNEVESVNKSIMKYAKVNGMMEYPFMFKTATPLFKKFKRDLFHGGH